MTRIIHFVSLSVGLLLDQVLVGLFVRLLLLLVSGKLQYHSWKNSRIGSYNIAYYILYYKYIIESLRITH